MKVIIDRFEGDFAVVELQDKNLVNIPVQCIPNGAKEGTVLSIEVDNEETEARTKRIGDLMKGVWQD
jgi:hypothetical protein